MRRPSAATMRNRDRCFWASDLWERIPCGDGLGDEAPARKPVPQLFRGRLEGRGPGVPAGRVDKHETRTGVALLQQRCRDQLELDALSTPDKSLEDEDDRPLYHGDRRRPGAGRGRPREFNHPRARQASISQLARRSVTNGAPCKSPPLPACGRWIGRRGIGCYGPFQPG